MTNQHISSTSPETDNAKKQFSDKKCFVVTPIGSANTPTRRSADGLLDSVLIPILQDTFGFKLIVAHRIHEPGSINAQVISELLESDLAVANLTDQNPNVMYEVGVRHAAGRRTIIVAEEPLELPFDIGDQRTIGFVNDMQGVEELKAKLLDAVPATMRQPEDEISNPVIDTMKRPILKETEPSGELEYVIRKLDRIERKLADRKPESQQQESNSGPWKDHRAVYSSSTPNQETRQFEFWPVIKPKQNNVKQLLDDLEVLPETRCLTYYSTPNVLVFTTGPEGLSQEAEHLPGMYLGALKMIEVNGK